MVLLTSYSHLFNTEPRFFDHFLNFPARANVHTYIYMLVWSSEVPSFASPDDVTLGQSGPFYLEFNEVLDICVITCYIIIMQQYLLKSEDFNE